MVFFTCNHCGGAVKKPAVQKHYLSRCKGLPYFVTCMDCQKDFRGDEYDAHIKCISETEKYSGKDYVPKPGQNKGQRKQDSWIDTIRSLSTDEKVVMDPKLRQVFERMISYENIPRKQSKFQNFISNSFKIPKPVAMKVWDILEKELAKLKNTNKESEKENAESSINGKNESNIKEDVKKDETLQNGEESSKKEKKKIKRKIEPVEAELENVGPKEKKKKKEKKTSNKIEVTDEEMTNGNLFKEPIDDNKTFDWITIIKENAKNGMKVDKLKKKIFKKFKKHNPDFEMNEKFEKKFKKFFKKSEVQIENDIIKIES